MSFSGCNEPGLQRKFGFSMITKCNLTKDYHICNSISNCVIPSIRSIHIASFSILVIPFTFLFLSFFLFLEKRMRIWIILSFPFFFHSQNPNSHTKPNSFNYRNLNCTYALLLLAYHKVGQHMYIRR